MKSGRRSGLGSHLPSQAATSDRSTSARRSSTSGRLGCATRTADAACRVANVGHWARAGLRRRREVPAHGFNDEVAVAIGADRGCELVGEDSRQRCVTGRHRRVGHELFYQVGREFLLRSRYSNELRIFEKLVKQELHGYGIFFGQFWYREIGICDGWPRMLFGQGLVEHGLAALRHDEVNGHARRPTIVEAPERSVEADFIRDQGPRYRNRGLFVETTGTFKLLTQSGCDVIRERISVG